jgi:hypothetical protein
VRPLPPLKPLSHLSFPALLTGVEVSCPKTINIKLVLQDFYPMSYDNLSSLPVKRGGSLSFLVGTISNILVMEIGCTDVGSGGYITSLRGV